MGVALGQPAAAGVGVGAGRPETAGVGDEAGWPEVGGVGVGVGKVVANGGTDVDTEGREVEVALAPQARLRAAIAERINIRMAGLIAGFMECIITSSPLDGPKG